MNDVYAETIDTGPGIQLSHTLRSRWQVEDRKNPIPTSLKIPVRHLVFRPSSKRLVNGLSHQIHIESQG